MKKALALVLSFMMIMSVCVVSAEYVFVETIPESGIVFFDDFEGYTAMTEAQMTNGGPWSNISGYALATIDGNNVYNTTMSEGYAFAYMGRFPGTINTGRVKFSFDLTGEVNYGSRFAVDASNQHPSTYVSIWTSANNVLYAMANAGDGIGYLLAEGSYAVTTDKTSAANCFEIDLSKTTNVAVILDYTVGKIEYYLDDTLIYTRSGTPAPLNASTGEIDIVSDKAKGTTYGPDDDNGGTYPSLYLDNITLEILAAEGGSGDSDYVPSDELTEPVELVREDFADDDWDNFVKTSDGSSVRYVGTSTIAEGVLTLSDGAYPLFNIPTTTETDAYELSYDVYAQGGRLVTYDYTKGNGSSSANTVGYKPGNGFLAGIDANGAANIAAADDSKWYTVKVEWCMAEENRYLHYTVYDRETGEKLGHHEVYGKWVTGQGADVSNYMPMQSIMLWNDGMTLCQIDNIVVSQIPTGYYNKTYQPQIWVNGVLATADTAISAGSTVEAQAFGPIECQMIVAAYDANNELQAVEVVDTCIRDRYYTSFTATEEDFAGADSVKAFLFTASGDGFKPVTSPYDSEIPVA